MESCHMSTACGHAQYQLLIQAISTTSWSGKICHYRDRHPVRTQSAAGAWRWNVKLQVVWAETRKIYKVGVAFLENDNCTMDLATVRHTREAPSIWWVQRSRWRLALAHISMVSFLIHQHPGLWQLTSERHRAPVSISQLSWEWVHSIARSADCVVTGDIGGNLDDLTAFPVAAAEQSGVLLGWSDA